MGNLFSKSRGKGRVYDQKKTLTIIVDLTAVACSTPTRVSVNENGKQDLCDPKEKEIALRCIGKEQKAK